MITGVSAGGGAYSPALTDFVVMTEGSAMFLTGPGVVREVMGEDVDARGLGGPRVHARNGVCQFVAANDHEAVGLVRELLAHLPQRAGERPPHGLPAPVPSHRPAARVPSSPRKVYDVRDVIRAVVDNEELLEVSERWARNMVTGVLPDRRARGRRDRQPALVPGRRDRRGRLAEGGEVRAHLQLVRAAAGGARRHARASCPAPSRRGSA